ncbi:MAG TPA: DUF3376 domain-containing protein [Propionibacterium sp.]|nr:DUF3376 domain-containing protein [Propionibacterium sp.]
MARDDADAPMARDDADAPMARDDAERGVHDAWRAILRTCGHSVIVDVIAGASAGGLNGTFLATAIARGSDLAGMKELWLDEAALTRDKLLWTDPKGKKSLLDGTFFEQTITDVLTGLSGQTGIEPGDCTLLVTATALGGAITTATLDDGEMSFHDSRRVYAFQRRASPGGSGPDDHFRPTESEPLARAARASASFPVAFSPVPESPALRVRRHPAVRTAPDASPATGPLLMDGGILDNAPFEPVIDALRERPISAPFDRVLLYVVPSVEARAHTDPLHSELADCAEGTAYAPGRDARRTSAAYPDPTEPSAWAVLKSLVGTSREADQRLDMEALREAFTTMGETVSKPEALLAQFLLGTNAPPVPDAAKALFEAYRAGRTEAVARQVDQEVTFDFRTPQPIDADREFALIVPDSLDPGRPWQWGYSTPDRILRWLGRALVSIAHDPTRTGTGSPAMDEAFRALGLAHARVQEQRERMPEQGHHLTHDASRRAGDDVDGDDPLGDAVRGATHAAARWMGVDPGELLEFMLSLEVVSSVFAWSSDNHDVPPFRLAQISPGAELRIDVGLGPGAEEEWPRRKLYGERWGRFGAFATRRGREHDWLWGRLDGAGSLADLLLADADLDQETKDTLVADLIDRILAAEGTSRQRVKADAHEVMRMDDLGLVEKALAETNGDGLVDRNGGDNLWDLLATIPEVFPNAGRVLRPALRVAHWGWRGFEKLPRSLQARGWSALRRRLER